MALMELFYKYCDYNAAENVEIENKESSCEEAMAERQRENESEELEETEFPLRESEQQREPSGPLPKQHYSISEWGDHMRQAEISNDFDKYKEMNPMGRQRDTSDPNNPNRRVLQKGKVTPSVRDLFRLRNS